MSPVRLSLVTEIPAPYRLPLFNALALVDDVELAVLFLAEDDPRRGYGLHRDEARFPHDFLLGWSIQRGRRWIVASRGTWRSLRRFRPDVIIVGGWNQPAFWQAIGYAAVRRVPLATWVESTQRDLRSGFGPLRLARWLAVARSAAIIVPGSAAAELAASLGADPEKIVVAPNAVDAEIFRGRVHETRRDSDRLRRDLGVAADACVVLYVGRLDPEKGLDLLFRAVESLPVEVVVVGSGRTENELREAAPPNVRFTGRLPRDELVPWYAAADIFVLPSLSEPWGMVLNEAAAAALPLVASDAAGASVDLIEDGRNGFRVPTGDVGALRAAIERLEGDAELRQRAARRSAEIAATFTPEHWAAAVAGLARSLAGRD